MLYNVVLFETRFMPRTTKSNCKSIIFSDRIERLLVVTNTFRYRQAKSNCVCTTKNIYKIILNSLLSVQNLMIAMEIGNTANYLGLLRLTLIRLVYQKENETQQIILPKSGSLLANQKGVR